MDKKERDDSGIGKKDIEIIVEEGKKVEDGMKGINKEEILGLCDEVDIM